MQTYVLLGLVLGSVYAVSGTALVVTYGATRVLNLAQGAISFTVADVYYTLHTTDGMGLLPAALLSMCLVAPAIGLFLWAAVFREARTTPVVVKIVTTIGVLVALPALDEMTMPHPQVYAAPGVVPPPLPVFHVLGTSVNGDQLAVLAGAFVVAVATSVLFRATRLGLAMRAVVDNPGVAELQGTATRKVEAAAWVIGAVLAGLAGVLLAPVLGLTPATYTSLTVTSVTVAVVAGLRSVPVAFASAIGIGVLQSVLVEYAPQGSILATGIQPAVPLIVLAVALLVRPTLEVSGAVEAVQRRARRAVRTASTGRTGRQALNTVALVVVVGVVLPHLLSDYWASTVVYGLAFAVVFLSFTILSSAGIMSLGQAAFAGVGGLLAGRLMDSYHVNALLAVVVAALAAALLGVVVGWVSTRLGVLALGVMTLAVAGFFDEFLSQVSWLVPPLSGGIGFTRPKVGPWSLTDDRSFAYLLVVVMVVGVVLAVRLRRGLPGLGLAAVRGEEDASRSIGLSPMAFRMTVFALSALVAGAGGALLGMFQLHLEPADVSTPVGLVWLAVVVTQGVRSPLGALVGGLAWAVIPAALSSLPTSWAQLPAVLFGLGAVALAREPDGMITMTQHTLSALGGPWSRLRRSARRSRPAGTADGDPAVAGAEQAQVKAGRE